MEIVNVIAWRRPDFLMATLKRLLMADEPGLHYRMNIDHDPDPAVLDIAQSLVEQVGADRVELIFRGPCRDQGPTRNMLTALHESITYDATLVHLVEDDVFPSVDYWEYHRSGHRLAPDAFCVTACNPAPVAEWIVPQNYGVCMLKRLAPTVGTSYKPERLREILEYLPLSYLDDRVGHIRRTFPGHPARPHQWNGIDGAMGRVLRRLGKKTLFPVVPRAYHAGYIGAGCEGGACNNNRTRDGYSNGPHRHGVELTGNVAERAEQLLAMKAADFNARAEVDDHVWIDLDVLYGPVTAYMD